MRSIFKTLYSLLLERLAEYLDNVRCLLSAIGGTFGVNVFALMGRESWFQNG